MTLKELREQRTQLAGQIQGMAKKIGDENREFTAEEDANWKKLNGDFDSLVKRCEAMERAEAVDASNKAASNRNADVGRGDVDHSKAGEESRDARKPQATEEHRSMALQGWANEQSGLDMTDEQREACQIVGLNPRAKQLVIPLRRTADRAKMARHFRSDAGQPHDREDRALSAVIGATGGYGAIPASMINSLEVNMLAFGGMLQAAETIRTATGEQMQWPTADDTSNTGRQIGENAAVTTTTQPSFAQVIWGAYKFSSDFILVPSELLRDASFDLPSVLGAMLGERLGRIQNTKFTTGTGAGTPKGITNCTSVGVTAASATAIAWTELDGMIHSVDPAYRQGAAWMFHDNIMLHLRKLLDGIGRPLWADGPNGTLPPTLKGYPYFINQDMQSSVATGTKTVLFGQLSKYKIRQVNNVRFFRLTERYRDNDQDGFGAFIESDGNLLTAGTAPVKHLLQA